MAKIALPDLDVGAFELSLVGGQLTVRLVFLLEGQVVAERPFADAQAVEGVGELTQTYLTELAALLTRRLEAAYGLTEVEPSDMPDLSARPRGLTEV